MMSDTIADMLTRIRNASAANHQTVAIPASKMKVEIAKVLAAEGFVDELRGRRRGAAAAADHHPQGAHTARARALRPAPDQPPRAARLRPQDRDPARARRPRHRHHLHLARSHDRPGRAARRPRWRGGGVRLVATMSRIGKLPITVPGGVEVTLDRQPHHRHRHRAARL